ncbi:MAG: acyltransferase [Gemmatimonadota bacterium]
MSNVTSTPGEAEAPAPIRSIPALESKASAKKHGQIPSLDGMRAVAFLIVFISHAGWQRLFPGGFGVTIFFFLSGYLITTLLREEISRYGDISFKLFYARRLLRIWPPFYTVLALATLATVTGVLTMKLQRAAMIPLLLHFTNYRTMWYGLEGAPPGTLVYWSLSVEEHFYLIFPVLLYGLYRLKWPPLTKAAALWALCALVLVWRTILVYGSDIPAARTYMGTDTRFDGLLFGCALALYGNPAVDPTRFSARTWKWIFLPLGIVFLLLTFLVRNPEFRETWRYSIQGIALVPVFVSSVRYPAWGPWQILNWSWIRGLGVLSYSLYLLHYCVIHAVQDHLHWPRVPAAFLALALTISISFAMYVLIERPCARVRKRLTR